MRKVIFVLLVVSSLCYQETIDKFNDRILVSDDSFGVVERKNSGKSFLPYFYTPEHISFL